MIIEIQRGGEFSFLLGKYVHYTYLCTGQEKVQHAI